jgi:TM2 domain-containing membrane protein YozV
MKSKTTTVILAFFLGGLGIHRFYLGQTGLGIAYLLFSWTLIPGLIAFIDFIGFLCMSDEFNRKYNSPKEVAVLTTPTNNVNTVAINMAGPVGSSTITSSDEIVKLYELKEKGIITQEEFELKKKTIL